MNKFLVTIVLLFCLSSELIAQISTNSPYSRFGLGDISQNLFPQFNALGGASSAINGPKIINPSNPATYTMFGPNSFLLSTGGWHQTTKMQNSFEKQITNNNSFSHLVIGFPLRKNIGFSFGMIPFSSMGYEMSSELIDDSNSQNNAIGTYSGDGGLSKFYFGSSYQVINGLSIGFNSSYLFGGLNRRKKLDYNDESFLNSRSNSKIYLQGYFYEFGLLYNKSLNDNEKYSIGISTNNNSKIRAKKTDLVETFNYSGFLEIPTDTFSNSVEWDYANLPQYINVGISYQKDKKWLFIADYSIQNWQDFSMFDEEDNLVNSTKTSAGVQFTPDYSSITNYLQRIDYRVGVNYCNTPLQFDDTQLEEISFSFGFGIPVKKSRTKYDFSCTLGQRGTNNNNLIKEQFIRLGLSVSYDGIWFVKRKYD